MDGLIGPIRDALHARRYGLKDRERTNALLMLMQLHANRRDETRTYTTDIRAWLEANQGCSPAVRRTISDRCDAGRTNLPPTCRCAARVEQVKIVR